MGFTVTLDDAFVTVRTVAAVDIGVTVDRTQRLIDLRLKPDDRAGCDEWTSSHPGDEVQALMGDVVVAIVEFRNGTARLAVWGGLSEGDKTLTALIG
jgi:hypothetical protein